MSESLKIFLLYASVTQLGLSPFALIAKNNIFALCLSIFILAAASVFFALFNKKADSKILFLTQRYYLLPIVITLSFVKELTLITKFLWLIFAIIGTLICFLELNLLKQKNYFLLLTSCFFSLCLLMLFHYFNFNTQALILSCIIVNFAMLQQNYQPPSKQLVIFVTILLILRLSFIFSGAFANKNLTFIVVYGIICTFFALRLKKIQYVNLLLYLFLSSFIPMHVNFSDTLSCFIGAMSLMFAIKSPVLFSVKSKYGKLQVVKFLLHPCHALFHNGIIHGVEHFDKSKLAYYQRESHIGKFLSALITPEKKLNIGVVGLGIGLLSLYAHNKNQKISFYEIDEELIKIAQNPNYFTIIKESKADINIIHGEARKTMQKEAEQLYDILIIDACCGDLVPSYLLSYEALKLYSKKIKNNGILILHTTASNISNEHLATIIEELNLIAYASCYKVEEDQKVIENQGLYYVKSSEHPFWDKTYKYIDGFLKICGLNLANIDNFDNDWIVIARDKAHLPSLTNSWVSLKSNQTLLLTDKVIGYRNF